MGTDQAHGSRPTPHLDVAIIGLGDIGRAHVDAVQRAHSTRLAALVDIDPARLEAVRPIVDCPSYESVEAMLAGSDVDMVMICTPDHLHVEPVRAACAAGKHVFLEKPIATTLDDVAAIEAAVSDAGVKFTVGHCLRFDPKYVEVKRRIDAGDLGEVVSVYARRQNRTVTPRRLGGRISSVMFLGVHDIDILNWYVGQAPVAVYAASANPVMRSYGFEIDDVTWTTIRYENGVIGVVESGWLLPEAYPRTGHFALVAMGTRGLANLDEFDEGLSIANEQYAHIPLVDRLTPQIEHFARAILDGREPLVTAADGRRAVEVALAAERSAHEHTEIPLASLA